MSKIKVSELFYSLQGEGMFIGVPSIFLRTFGCNFTCSGYGRRRYDTTPEERMSVDPTKFTDYKQLPLVHTGCDSYASWDPRFKHLSPLLEISSIVDTMSTLLPNNTFSKNKHLIITGGEPLLGWQKQYPELIREIRHRQMGLTDLTFETNGTQEMKPELFDFLSSLCSEIKTTFSVSAKLPVSGEAWEEAIIPQTVHQYTCIPGANVYLKFVVSSYQDIDDVHKAVKEYRESGVNVPIYLMPVGGTADSYSKYEKDVASLCMDAGYRFSPRIQVPLFKNAWGT